MARNADPGATRTRRPRGFSLVEVLVTLVLLAIGLAGLAGLQARTAITGIEAYQRTQALLLAEDMASRIAANRSQASRYVGDDYGVGLGEDCPAVAGVEADRCAWSNGLRGASERIGAQAVGTVSGGIGCVRSNGADRIDVIVAWQGLLRTAAPAAECGRGRYGDDALRRAVVVPVHVARARS
jgi:type IV pilus assembly protein PilV